MFRGTFNTDEAIQKNEIYYPELLNKTKIKPSIRDKRDYTTFTQNSIALYK